MATYTVAIGCDGPTSDYLTNNKFQLVAWKGVTSAFAGQPTVWFTYGKIGLTNTLTWQESFECYSSTSAIVPNGSITTSNTYDIDFGNIFTITNATSGTGAVTSGGNPGDMTIVGMQGAEFTVGISQKVGNTNPAVYNPLVAFDLAGNTSFEVVPIEHVLLTFMTGTVNTGTVYYNATTSGILVDVTAYANKTLDVTYNKLNGWSCSDALSKTIAAGADLSALLVTAPTTMASRSREVIRMAHRQLRVIA